MYISTSSLVLGALAIAEASAASIIHGKAHNHAARHVETAEANPHHAARMSNKRDTNWVAAAAGGALADTGAALLSSFGFKAMGINNKASAGNKVPWIGTDGPYTNQFFNNAGEDAQLVIWGPAGSWVNAVQPHITVTIPNNGSTTISFPDGWSGAWAPVYKSTKMVNGQISDTWGEATFANPWSTFDVSREVNMNGRTMSIVGPKCTSDMTRCVFKCPAGQTTCMYGYTLENCSPGSQAGAQTGYDNGAASGGCSGMGATAQVKTYFS